MALKAAVFLNAHLRFLHTPCTRVLSTRWLNCSKRTSVLSQVKKLKAGSDVLLSPEQLERIARNKAAALERLSARRVPVGVGESWRRALGAEFNKHYFTSVITAFFFLIRFSCFFFNRAFVYCIFFSSVNELRAWWETEAHRVSSPGAGVHMDTDVPDWRCEFLHMTLACRTQWMKVLWSRKNVRSFLVLLSLCTIAHKQNNYQPRLWIYNLHRSYCILKHGLLCQVWITFI